MGEVLSQNEIDDLLNALNTGELDVEEYKHSASAKHVKEYDFARPSKFAKEHLRTLEIIFEHYARLVSTALPAYMRTSCQVEVINSEAVAFSEFSNALSNPILLGIMDLYPLKGNVLMDLSVKIGFSIIDRLLGGKGETLDKERDFSEIELAIIEKIMVICVDLLVEPWENVVGLEPRLEKIETNSQFAQVISPTEIIALLTLNLRIGNVEGLVNICIPYTCVEPIIDKLNTKFWFSSMTESNEEVYRDIIEKRIAQAQIPVKAILGKSIITVNDFINLQIGDIIKLDKKITEDIEVKVGDIEKFTAKAGLFEKKNAVQIVSILRKEE
ncbi:flagellar motor switch protein FliM [Petrocella sp. FN5]|uniref:flagellar motor switch protein FliM n=1 Tax=Petrocella sp. FN5 TaxID=3032002 RepID=UPI0023DB928C|nr:flagellar motor switch protein FliM [Petrocella sp. FN5]MDF1616818.1 flagellar motor switch protein FliM [Petrocella sp. FN5]